VASGPLVGDQAWRGAVGGVLTILAIWTYIIGAQLATTWLIFGLLVVLLIVTLRAYARAARDRDRADTPSGRGLPRTQWLQPRYSQSEPYRHPQGDSDWIIEHRLGVFNPGSQVADRVRVELARMEPYPRHVHNGYDPVIPYVVPLLTGGNESVGTTLQAGTEELWKLGYTATGSTGIMNAGGFAVEDQKWRGTPWAVDSDERWRLFYRVVARDRPDVDFSIVVYADGGHLRCQLEGPTN